MSGKAYTNHALWQTIFQGSIAVLLAVLLLLSMIYFMWRSFDEKLHTVTVQWSGEAVAVRIGVDSPYVISYLAYPTFREGDAIAALPEPLLIVESRGGQIDAATMKRLVWRSEKTQQRVDPPVSGTPIWALYHRAVWTPERSAYRQRR
jgi:hypothetical protein